jgi:hypothetical protein
MSFEARITKSYDGRRFGLQIPSSVELGSTFGPAFLAGPESLRQNVTTAETTSVPLKPFGLTWFGTTTTGAGSSAVYTLAPPIPGVTKSFALTCGASEGPIYIKTLNSETLNTSAGSSFTVIKLSTLGNLELLGLSTARWLVTAGAPLATFTTTT